MAISNPRLAREVEQARAASHFDAAARVRVKRIGAIEEDDKNKPHAFPIPRVAAGNSDAVATAIIW